MNSYPQALRGIFVAALCASSQASATPSELGVKFGYQRYDNQYDNPASFTKGLFVNTPITQALSIESSLLFLGEAQENNHNIGAFTMGELSARYQWDVSEQSQVFGKVGLAPWFGYVNTPKGGRDYEYGLTGTVGVGYRFHLIDQLYARVEYQFTPDLGGDTIGYADSHLLSVGLSWQLGSSSPKRPPTPTAHQAVAHQPQTAYYTSTPTTPKPVDEPAQAPYKLTLQGTWLFDNNASTLSIPQPLQTVDEARQRINHGCALLQISVAGYADSVGDTTYNQWLSERRAQNVAQYLSHALHFPLDEMMIAGYGSERLAPPPQKAPYERRVDFDFRFQCWDK